MAAVPSTAAQTPERSGEDRRPSDLEWRRRLLLLVALLAAVLVPGCLLFFSPGFFTIDELTYVLMIEAALDGRLTVDNGYEAYGSPLLVVNYLVAGPQGLVGQYPSGYTFLAAPFYWLGGVRGLLLLNTLAYIAAVPLTYALARQLFASGAVAFTAALIFAVGSYALPYAAAIWPHSLSILFVLGGALALTCATRTSGTRAAGMALLGGLIIGLGVNVRADVILLLPALLLWVLSRHTTWRLAPWLGTGLLPGLALSAWLNALKFGTWSLLSYGRDSGDTSLESYMPLAAAGLGVLLLTMLLAHPRGLRVSSGRAGVAITLVAIAVLLIVEEVGDLAWQAIVGFYALVVDLQALPGAGADPRISETDDGLLLFSGTLKRALVQSLPYLGVVAMAVPALWRGQRRRLYGFLLLICLIWIALFAVRQWHGGSMLNMRYFLPLLPFLAILVASALEEVWKVAVPPPGRRLLYGLRIVTATVLLLVATLLAVFFQPAVGGRLALYLPLALAGLLGLGSLVIHFGTDRWRRRGARLTLTLAVAALVWAGGMVLAYDLTLTQSRRAHYAAMNELAAQLEDGILVMTGAPYFFHPQFRRPGSLVAVPPLEGQEDVAVDLILHQLDENRPVYVHGRALSAIVLEAGNFTPQQLASLEIGLLEFTIIRPAIGGGCPGRC